MSAFIVSEDHIDALIEFGKAHLVQLWFRPNGEEMGIEYDFRVTPDRNELGSALINENLKSFNYRYRDDVPVTHYVSKTTSRLYDPVQILKALSCWEYQSCEHPDFRSSLGFAVMEALRKEAINHLEGYEAAMWEIRKKIETKIADDGKLIVLKDEDFATSINPKHAPKPAAMKIIELPDPAMPTAREGKGIINVKGVKTRKSKHGEAIYPLENADIVKNKTIRIYGLSEKKHHYDKALGMNVHYRLPFDNTFEVGDRVEYGSYNRTYTGHIAAIGEKVIKIDEGYGKFSQLDLHTFIWRNWDLNLAKIDEDNGNYYD